MFSFFYLSIRLDFRLDCRYSNVDACSELKFYVVSDKDRGRGGDMRNKADGATSKSSGLCHLRKPKSFILDP